MTRVRIGLVIAAMTLIGAFAGGCEEGSHSTSSGQAGLPEDVKMQRLFAAENQQLKEESERLKGQVEQQKQQLAACEMERQGWKDKAQIEIKENVEGILKTSLEQNVALNNEIEQLKEEIAKLKGQTSAGQQAMPEQPKENEPNTSEEQPKASEDKPGLPI